MGNFFTTSIYKQKYSFESRRKRAQEILHFERCTLIPVVMELDPSLRGTKKMPELSDPVNSYNGQNMIVDILSALRVSLPLRAGEPLVLMAGNETLNAKDTLQCVYDRHKDRDGFLYLYYKR